MRLSYSSISTYQNCPLAYKFQFVDKLPTKKTPQLSFGSSLHSVLAYFYDVPYPKPYSLDELLGYLPKAWESEGYLDRQEEQTYFEHAKEILAQFYHSNIDSFQIPIALEHKFQIELNSCTLTGVIDRVDKLPSGGYEVIDYKTNRKLPPKSKIDSNLQLSIYYLACQEIWRIEPEKLSLYFLIPNEKVSTKRTESDIKKTKSLIEKVREDISAEKFQPRENPLCPWCDFQAYCPYHKHKFPQEEDTISASRTLEIESILNEFISIKGKIKDFNSKLSELQEIIHSYCDEHNISRLNCEKGTILRNKRITQSYNVEKLKEILQPLGLWEQILTVDSTSLKNLINNESISEEIKESIRAAVETEDISYALFIKESSSNKKDKIS